MNNLPKPNLNNYFPNTVNDLKISNDLNNRVHGPHYDVIQGIRGGTDQIRVDNYGNVIGGTTNIGKAKLDWNP